MVSDGRRSGSRGRAAHERGGEDVGQRGHHPAPAARAAPGDPPAADVWGPGGRRGQHPRARARVRRQNDRRTCVRSAPPWPRLSGFTLVGSVVAPVGRPARALARGRVPQSARSDGLRGRLLGPRWSGSSAVPRGPGAQRRRRPPRRVTLHFATAGSSAIAAIALEVQNSGVRHLAVPDLTTTVLTVTLTGIGADVRGATSATAVRRSVTVTGRASAASSAPGSSGSAGRRRGSGLAAVRSAVTAVAAGRRGGLRAGASPAGPACRPGRPSADPPGGPPGAAQTTTVIPPSTKIVWPLTKSEAGEASQTAGPTRSAVVPQRAAGVRPTTQAVKSASSTSACVISVAR